MKKGKHHSQHHSQQQGNSNIKKQPTNEQQEDGGGGGKKETHKEEAKESKDDHLAAIVEPVSTPNVVVQRPRSYSYTAQRPKLPENTDPFRRREIKRYLAVACVVLEKCLSNLGVISELQVGDKLDFTSTGDFVIHRPTWFNTITRTVKGIDRWRTHEHISNLVNTAEAIVDERNAGDPRVREALVSAAHGLRNLQETYEDDPTFRNKIKVLLQRVEMRYDIQEPTTLLF